MTYCEFGEAGVLARLKQDARGWRDGRRGDVCTPVAVLVLLLADPRRGGRLGVVLRVGRLRESLLTRAPGIVPGVVAVVAHGRREGLRGRGGHAAGVVGGSDFSGRTHEREQHRQQHEAVQDAQQRQDGQHGKEVSGGDTERERLRLMGDIIKVE